MGANLSLQRLSCGHVQKTKTTKKYQEELNTLKEKLFIAISMREYTLKELSDALEKIEVLKSKFNIVRETLRTQKGCFDKVSEASKNQCLLIETKKAIENIIGKTNHRISSSKLLYVQLFFPLDKLNSRQSKCKKDLKIGNVCKNCALVLEWHDDRFTDDWDDSRENSIKNNVSKHLKLLSDLEEKISIYPEKMFKNYESELL